MTTSERLVARTAGVTALVVLLVGLGAIARPHPSAVVPAGAPATPGFTLAEVAAGTVDPVVHDRFWAQELERLSRRPCASGDAEVDVTVFVGADDAWQRRLTEAVRTRGVACRAAVRSGGTGLSAP